MVAIAEHRDGGQWLVDLGARMHRLIVGTGAGEPRAPAVVAAGHGSGRR
jgi:hypothetical protein